MITLIGLPSTVPPKSSTAICAAVTEPWPVGVDAGPFMSVRTPILTTSSEICARAGDASAAAASSPSANPRLAEIKAVLPNFLVRRHYSGVAGRGWTAQDRGRVGPVRALCNQFTDRVNGGR